MSSLTSSTKVPSQPQQVVYYAPPPPETKTSVQSEEGGERDTTEAESKAREKNLLARERGSIGTIQTSFRGLLSTIENTGKSLLGQ